MSHYFGSTAYNWATGATRNEVLAKLAKAAGAAAIRRNVEANGGLYVWMCKVPLPIDAPYEIEFYAPKVEGLTEKQAYLIQNTKGFVTLFEEES